MRFSNVVTALLFLSGSVLLGGMVYHVGLTVLLESFRLLGPWLLPYGLLGSVPLLLHTAAWTACFPPRQLPLPLWQLALVRQAGNTINHLTPTADIGGEVSKVLLLERVVPQEQALAAVVIEKGSITLAKMIYLALGILYLKQHLPLPTELYVGSILTIGLISLGLAGFIACQRYGLLSGAVRRMAHLGIGSRRLQQLGQRLARVDAQLVAYYTHHPWRFVRSLCLHFVAFMFNVVMMYILFRLVIGESAPSFVKSIMVTIAIMALDQMFFFVPGGIGTLEGTRFVVLSSLGMAHVYGLAFGMIARAEQLASSGLGILAYALAHRLLSHGRARQEAKASSAS